MSGGHSVSEPSATARGILNANLKSKNSEPLEDSGLPCAGRQVFGYQSAVQAGFLPRQKVIRVVLILLCRLSRRYFLLDQKRKTAHSHSYVKDLF